MSVNTEKPGLILHENLTEEEQASNNSRLCALLDCPPTGPEPVADLFDFLDEQRRRRGDPPITWGQPTENERTHSR